MEKELCNLIDDLINDGADIVYASTLKDFAIQAIEEDNFNLGAHIANVLAEYPDVEYFIYDCNMGTLSTPQPIYEKEDLEQFFEDDSTTGRSAFELGYQYGYNAHRSGHGIDLDDDHEIDKCLADEDLADTEDNVRNFCRGYYDGFDEAQADEMQDPED